MLASMTRALSRTPGSGPPAQTKRPTEHGGVGRERDELRGEADREPRRVGPLDRVPYLGEARRASQEEPDADDEEHRGADPEHRVPAGRNGEPCGAIVTHVWLDRVRHRHESRRATAPSAAPATASRT